jgi:hypothetical protein
VGNLNTKGAKVAAVVVALASITYGLIPKTPDSTIFDNCGSILFPGSDSGELSCGDRMSPGLLWLIIVVSVAAAIYLIVKDNDDNS